MLAVAYANQQTTNTSSSQVQSQVIVQYTPLVHKIVGQWVYQSDPQYDDYIQEGFIALLNAHQSFFFSAENKHKHSDSKAFISYASVSIRNRFIDLYRGKTTSWNQLVLEPGAEDYCDNLEHFELDEFEESILNERCITYLLQQIDEYQSLFPPRGIMLIKQKYLEELPVSYLAKLYGLSEASIFKITRQTLADMRDILIDSLVESDGLNPEDYLFSS